MKIAFVASEANPLAKTGGLADVVHALAVELTKKGDEVIIVMPYFRSMAKHKEKYGFKALTDFPVYLSWRTQKADVSTCEIHGVKYYLIGNGYYFDRDDIYGYGDDGERFAFFTLASKILLNVIDFHPDIVHVHDWQSGMLPLLCKAQPDPVFAKSHYVLTIHNPAFKGQLDANALSELYNLPQTYYDSGEARFEGGVSTLKAGIVFADKITAVSPNNRSELLTPSGGQGLADVLWTREYDFTGFANGIDTDEFDPEHDEFLTKPYNAKAYKTGKKAARKAVLERFGLEDNGGPIFGFVTRLTYQKGIDLILQSAYRILSAGGIILALGSGEAGLENALNELQRAYPSQVGVYIGYSNEIAHLVYGGSDFFLMPSLFEPCGIGQMVAERYGTLPIARDVGGLHDTIVPFEGDNADKANGFLFRDYSREGMEYGIMQALSVFDDATTMDKMIKNAMKTDNSWKASAKLYHGLYAELVARN